MTDAPAPDPAPRGAPDRPWWVPLLGVGSVGLGGLLALTGLAGAGIALLGPPASLRAILLASLAWLIPGALLAASGVGVVLGRRWGRVLSLAAVAVGAAGLAAVGLARRDLPPAVAGTAAWAFEHPEAPPWAERLRADIRRREGADPLDLLREPAYREGNALTFAGYCCCPVLPWYLVLLLACAPPWGASIVRRDGGGGRTGAGGAS